MQKRLRLFEAPSDGFFFPGKGGELNVNCAEKSHKQRIQYVDYLRLSSRNQIIMKRKRRINSYWHQKHRFCAWMNVLQVSELKVTIMVIDEHFLQIERIESILEIFLTDG